MVWLLWVSVSGTEYLICTFCQVYFKGDYLISFFPYTAVVYVMICSWLFA